MRRPRPPLLLLLFIFRCASHSAQEETAIPTVPDDDMAFLDRLHAAQTDLGLVQEHQCLPTLQEGAAPRTDPAIDPDSCLATLRNSGGAVNTSATIHSTIARMYFDRGVEHLHRSNGRGGEAARRAFHLALTYAAVDYTVYGGDFIARRTGLQWDDIIRYVFVETKSHSKSAAAEPTPPPGHTAAGTEEQGTRGATTRCPTENQDQDKNLDQLRQSVSRSQQRVDANRVALVTLCAYDAADSPLSALSMHNKVEYATRHGYDFFGETQVANTSRRATWSKIPLLQKYLQIEDGADVGAGGTRRNKYDWVFWIDCDSIIMNTDVRLENLLDRVLGSRDDSEGSCDSVDAASSNAQKGDLAHGRVDPATQTTPDLILTEDGAMLNGGFFAVRNSRWSRHFLSTVWGDESNMFIPHVWNEQATMQFMVHHMSSAQRRRHLRYLAQRECNAYPVEYTDGAVHEAYVAGDFVVAFSGCRTYISATACNALIRRYSSESGVWTGRQWDWAPVA